MGTRRQDPYAVLGVNPDAPHEVIRAAYRALAAKYHPDRNPDDREAELRLKQLNAAFQVVGDPEKRKQYDELTRAPEPDGEPQASPDRRSPEPPPSAARSSPATFDKCWNCGTVHASDRCPKCREKNLRVPHGSRAQGVGSRDDSRGTGPNVKERTARWGFITVVCFVVGAVLGVVFDSPVAGALMLGTVPALVCCRLLFLAMAGVREPPRSARPATSTRAAGVFGRVMGWGLGFALLSAVVAALHEGDDKPAGGSVPKAAAAFTATTTAQDYRPAQRFTQPDYSIAFPDAPEPTKQNSVTTRFGPAKESLTELVRPSGAFYAVQETDYPSGTAMDEQGSIDGALKGASTSTSEPLTLTSDRRAMIGKCNGRDFSATANTFTFRCLLCINGSHAYMAMALKPNAVDGTEASAFLGSFSVTAPASAGTAKVAPWPARSAAPVEQLPF